jgi:hypothetical protein
MEQEQQLQAQGQVQAPTPAQATTPQVTTPPPQPEPQQKEVGPDSEEWWTADRKLAHDLAIAAYQQQALQAGILLTPEQVQARQEAAIAEQETERERNARKIQSSFKENVKRNLPDNIDAKVRDKLAEAIASAQSTAIAEAFALAERSAEQKVANVEAQLRATQEKTGWRTFAAQDSYKEALLEQYQAIAKDPDPVKRLEAGVAMENRIREMVRAELETEQQARQDLLARAYNTSHIEFPQRRGSAPLASNVASLDEARAKVLATAKTGDVTARNSAILDYLAKKNTGG